MTWTLRMTLACHRSHNLCDHQQCVLSSDGNTSFAYQLRRNRLGGNMIRPLLPLEHHLQDEYTGISVI